MFKKRNNTKKINLNQELQNIHAPLVQEQKPQNDDGSAQKKDEQKQIQRQHENVKKNNQQLEDYEMMEMKRQVFNKGDEMQNEMKEQQNKQFLQYFEEYKKQLEHQKQIQRERERQMIDENEQEIINAQKAREKAKMNKVQIIIDDDEDGKQMLEIGEDNGQLSPEEESQDYQNGYENEIIRKTLTRQNYLKVSEGLMKAKKQTKKQALLKAIEKTSYQSIQKKIAKDLRKKTQERDELLKEMKYIDNKLEQRGNYLQQKRSSIQNVHQEFENVKKVLQFLYYYGDKVNEFDEDTILKQVMSMNINEGKQNENGRQVLEISESENNDCIIMEDQYM